MNEREYNNQEIKEYLLGSLPEAETERFDELSFTDENFADALKSVENDLIDAYIHGELSATTLEKFNSYYLVSPLRREKVNFAKSFQVHAAQSIAKTSSENSIPAEPDPKQKDGFFSALNIFANPAFRWSFAAAALIFVAFGGFWIVKNRLNQPEIGTQVKQATPTPPDLELPKQLENNNAENSGKEVAAANSDDKPPQNSQKEKIKKLPNSEPPQKQSPILPKATVASFILTPPLRGGNQIQSLSIPEKTVSIAMKLQLESDDYTAYHVALVNDSEKNLWQSGRLKPKSKGSNKELNFSFPAKLLKSQIYSFTVSGIKADGAVEIISNYPFRSVLK